MNFRSSIKLAILSGILASSTAIAASNPPDSIVVYNKTSTNSTLKVTSGDLKGYCVGDKLYTTPGETKKVSWTSVNMLCYGTFPCTAQVYVGKKHDCKATKGSDDQLAGTVSLDVNGNIIAKPAKNHVLKGGMATLTISK